jgi:hypothetical protein
MRLTPLSSSLNVCLLTARSSSIGYCCALIILLVLILPIQTKFKHITWCMYIRSLVVCQALQIKLRAQVVQNHTEYRLSCIYNNKHNWLWFFFRILFSDLRKGNLTEFQGSGVSSLFTFKLYSLPSWKEGISVLVKVKQCIGLLFCYMFLNYCMMHL